jgi:hypothetical protein
MPLEVCILPEAYVSTAYGLKKIENRAHIRGFAVLGWIINKSSFRQVYILA